MEGLLSMGLCGLVWTLEIISRVFKASANQYEVLLGVNLKCLEVQPGGWRRGEEEEQGRTPGV